MVVIALGYGDEATAAKLPSRVTIRAAGGRDKRGRVDGATDAPKRIRTNVTGDTSSNGDATSDGTSLASTTPHLPPAAHAPSEAAAAMTMMDPSDPAFTSVLGTCRCRSYSLTHLFANFLLMA
jgi:hypothetical protein